MSAREALNIFWEAMVVELRAVRLELDNHRHFTKENQPIETARDYLHRWTVGREQLSAEVVTSRTVSSMNRATAEGLVEMG